MTNFFNPTEEHQQLRKMLQDFTMNEIEPQAQHINSAETFNLPLSLPQYPGGPWTTTM